MCGRYVSTRTPAEVRAAFAAAGPVRTLAPRYNIAPSSEVYVVAERPPPHGDGAGVAPAGPTPPDRRIQVMEWGFTPAWGRPGQRLINARVETVATKPTFRSAFARRRGLVPADGYYEWYRPADAGPKPRKQPFYIHPDDGALLAIAALFEIHHEPPSGGAGVDIADPPDGTGRFRWTCTFLTAPAVPHLAGIHDRMPLFVPPSHYDDWLDPTQAGTAQFADRFRSASNEEVAPTLIATPVADLVSRVGNDGPELIEPIPVVGDRAVDHGR